MSPRRESRSSFGCFLAILLITGQLGWGLPPLAADTLRPSMEGAQAGLEEALQTAGLEEPTDKEIGDVIDVLWSETDPGKRARAGGKLHGWLVPSLEQGPSPPQPASSQDAVRISAESLSNEIKQMEGWQRVFSRTFVRMIGKIKSADRDLIFGRPEILPVIEKWRQMMAKAQARIVTDFDELERALSGEFDRSQREETGIYQEEMEADLMAIQASMRNEASEAVGRLIQEEKEIERLVESLTERVRSSRLSGHPKLRKLPPIGTSEKSGLEETQEDAVWLQRWAAQHRPAPPTLTWVILGASVARDLPLQVLAGMENGFLWIAGEIPTRWL